MIAAEPIVKPAAVTVPEAVNALVPKVVPSNVNADSALIDPVVPVSVKTLLFALFEITLPNVDTNAFFNEVWLAS